MLFQTYDAPIVDLSTHDILLESYWVIVGSRVISLSQSTERSATDENGWTSLTDGRAVHQWIPHSRGRQAVDRDRRRSTRDRALMLVAGLPGFLVSVVFVPLAARPESVNRDRCRTLFHGRW